VTTNNGWESRQILNRGTETTPSAGAECQPSNVI
jgi:hypothetical protein